MIDKIRVRSNAILVIASRTTKNLRTFTETRKVYEQVDC